MSKCSSCKRDLPAEAFSKDRNRPCGLTSRCKECRNSARRTPEAREKEREGRRTYRREYKREYLKDPEKRAASNARRATYRQTEAGRLSDRNTGNARRARIREATVGTVTRADIDRLIAEFEGRCAYCSAPWEHLDHYIPLARGGSHSIDNLVPACSPCNRSKSARLPIFEWVGRPTGGN